MNGLNNVTNPQSISNTTVQPSVLNGGNLSKTFNTQVMKVIKGVVNLSSENQLPRYQDQTAILYPVIDETTGNPIMLGQSDFIVGYGICNRSTNVVAGQTLVSPLTPANSIISTEIIEGNSPVLELRLTAQSPFYNNSTKTWSFDRDGYHGLDVTTLKVTPVFANGPVSTSNNSGATGYTGGVNLGFGSLTTAYSYILSYDLPVINYYSCISNTWLQLRQNYNPFTIEPPAVNAGTIAITLIVMCVLNGTTETVNSDPPLLLLQTPHVLKSTFREGTSETLRPLGPLGPLGPLSSTETRPLGQTNIDFSRCDIGPHKSVYYKF